MLSDELYEKWVLLDVLHVIDAEELYDEENVEDDEYEPDVVDDFVDVCVDDRKHENDRVSDMETDNVCVRDVVYDNVIELDWVHETECDIDRLFEDEHDRVIECEIVADML